MWRRGWGICAECYGLLVAEGDCAYSRCVDDLIWFQRASSCNTCQSLSTCQSLMAAARATATARTACEYRLADLLGRESREASAQIVPSAARLFPAILRRRGGHNVNARIKTNKHQTINQKPKTESMDPNLGVDVEAGCSDANQLVHFPREHGGRC